MLMGYLDLVDDCDNFPYYETEPERYTKLVKSYFKLYLDGPEHGSGPHGYLPSGVVDAMPWNDQWIIDHRTQRVKPNLAAERTKSQNGIIDDTLSRARALSIFKVLDGWRNELYPILGHEFDVKECISVERAASPLFGINTYGVHMTCYTYVDNCIKIWVPRRAATKQTYGGMLDNSVAGGIATGEEPFECLVREAEEEASLPQQLVRSDAKACGTVSYFHIRDKRAGGEVGLLQPECQFVYDMRLEPDVEPKPNDEEVQEFQLWGIEDVKQHLTAGEFKPNCALVVVDFFVRHGILTPENERDYIEIVSRLHRKLPFPTRGL